MIEQYASRVDWYGLWMDAEIELFLSGHRRRVVNGVYGLLPLS